MRRFARISRLAFLAFAVTLAVTSDRVYAQTLTITSNTLASTVTPTVADFRSGGTNNGTTISAGVVTLNITSCQKNTTCTLKISASTVPTVGALNWQLTNAGSPSGNNISCAPASPQSGTLTTTPTTVLVCTLGNGGNNQDQTGIQISFSYPVSWTGTPFGTYATSGVSFRLSSP